MLDSDEPYLICESFISAASIYTIHKEWKAKSELIKSVAWISNSKYKLTSSNIGRLIDVFWLMTEFWMRSLMHSFQKISIKSWNYNPDKRGGIHSCFCQVDLWPVHWCHRRSIVVAWHQCLNNGSLSWHRDVTEQAATSCILNTNEFPFVRHCRAVVSLLVYCIERADEEYDVAALASLTHTCSLFTLNTLLIIDNGVFLQWTD